MSYSLSVAKRVRERRPLGLNFAQWAGANKTFYSVMAGIGETTIGTNLFFTSDVNSAKWRNGLIAEWRNRSVEPRNRVVLNGATGN